MPGLDIREHVAAFTHDANTSAKEQFLLARCGLGLHRKERQLCNVMVAASRGQSSLFPWLTPVLGSGVVSDSYARVVAISRASGAATAVASLYESSDARQFTHREIIEEFAESLIDDRLSDEPELETEEIPADDHELERGACLLATALLTRSYHMLRSLANESIPRRRRTAATERESADYALIGHTTEAIQLAMGHVEDDGAQTIFRKALDRLQPSGGRPASIELSTIRLLNEYSWHLLLGSVYPGWSDLLWGLFMEGQDWREGHEGRGPRPIKFNLDNVARSVRKMLKYGGTEIPGAGQHPYGSVVYGHVAELLIAQAKMASGMATARRVPVAAAFVTTFDLELETALLNAGEPFVVAMPVTRRSASEARVEWLGYTVSESGNEPPSLSSVVQPSDFFLLSNKSDYYLDKRKKLPHVVRLAGSPIVELPPNVGELWQDSPGIVEHAVILDEFAAIAQSTSTLTYRQREEEGESLRPGLPVGFTSLHESEFVRFWMLLGVQMGDAAIRHAVAIHVGHEDGQRRAIRNGVAINQHVTGEAEDLMLWSGLDVVEEGCEEFLEELDHYIEHLQPGGLIPMPEAPGATCRLLTEKAV